MFGESENMKEWKLEGIKIEIKIFLFDIFRWRGNWEKWKYKKWEYCVKIIITTPYTNYTPNYNKLFNL